MKLEFTAVFQRVPEGYMDFIEELPGANTQGAILDEARKNLAEAAQLVVAANRDNGPAGHARAGCNPGASQDHRGVKRRDLVRHL